MATSTVAFSLNIQCPYIMSVPPSNEIKLRSPYPAFVESKYENMKEKNLKFQTPFFPTIIKITFTLYIP